MITVHACIQSRSAHPHLTRPQGAWFPPFVEMAIALDRLHLSRTSWAPTCADGLSQGVRWCMAPASQCIGQSLSRARTCCVIVLLQRRIGIGQLAVLAIMLPALALFAAWFRAAGIIVRLQSSRSSAAIGSRSAGDVTANMGRRRRPGLISVAQWAILLVTCVAASLLTKNVEKVAAARRSR
jgi:hypothetical protein